MCYVWAKFISYLDENAYNLTALFSLQFSYAIISFNHLHRFYVDGLTRGTLIMYNTLNAPFMLRLNRNYQTTITHCRLNIQIYPTLFAGITHYASEHSGQTAFTFSEFLSYTPKFFACCIFYFPLGIQQRR